MAEEMVETESWESGEAEDWESDEAVGESEDSAEDIGERARRRNVRRNLFRPGRGVQGIVVRGQDGRPRNVRFPAKLATTAETNRGLATQEAGRRALEEKMERLENKYGAQLKKDSSAMGLVSLGVGGGLTVYGAIRAAQQTSGSKLGDWASRESTHIAAVMSVTQLATSGAKLLMNGRYHRSGIAIAADVFAVAQLAAFAFGSLYQPGQSRVAATFKEAQDHVKNNVVDIGTHYVLRDSGDVYRVEVIMGDRILRRAS